MLTEFYTVKYAFSTFCDFRVIWEPEPNKLQLQIKGIAAEINSILSYYLQM